jgi:hypothetical protein
MKRSWRKLNQRDPRFHIFADKVAVKGEIEKLIGKKHLIETLLVVDDRAGFKNLHRAISGVSA